MNKVLVLGAGKFGKLAARSLAGRASQIVIVDNNPEALVFAADGPLLPVCADWISFLEGNDIAIFDWIIPALPVHVAFAWVLSRLQETGIRPAAVAAGLDIPGCFYSGNGTVYASLSKHICPEDCPEPKGFCYLTGEERPLPLYRLLSALRVDGSITHLLRSHQLAPGVGGFAPLQLENLAVAVSAARLPGLVISSCACHAVINAYSFE